MNTVGTFFRELTLRLQGTIVVIAAFLPIIAIVAMDPAVPTMIQYFADCIELQVEEGDVGDAVMVNTLSSVVDRGGSPLKAGRIALEFEAAEVFFRNVRIRDLGADEIARIKGGG